jgi:hypothetical protein
MSNETRYEATETGIDILPRGRAGWRSSITDQRIIGELTCASVTNLLNAAYRNGRDEQREDIRKALGVR